MIIKHHNHHHSLVNHGKGPSFKIKTNLGEDPNGYKRKGENKAILLEARVTVPSIGTAADLPAFIDLSGLGGRRTSPSLAGGFPLNVLGW
jgi:hypothetical protein